MDIFFQDPNEIPLPPGEVRIRVLQAAAYPDGRRVRIHLEVDPFQKRPSAEIIIVDADGQPLAMTNIIETLTRKMDLTMHIRQEVPPGEYRVKVELFYSETNEAGGEEAAEAELPEPVITRVDQAETTFKIPAE